MSLRADRLVGCLCAALLLSATSHAQSLRPLVVMTAYPDNVVARVEAAFEAANPDIDLQVLWRSSGDALDWLAQPGHAPVDVYWAASPRTFERLKQDGALRVLSAGQRALPTTIGSTVLADADGHYVATEVAGYGFALNAAALQSRGVAMPVDWADLGRAEYAGLLALPVPSVVGYAPVMMDIVLQAYGWDAGWRVWSEIAGNARLIRRGANLVSDEVVSGRSAVGLSIDFFVAAEIASGAPIDFVYPTHGGLNPAHVAILQEAANLPEAKRFVDYILSVDGQRELAHPDIRKLPANPAVYASLDAGYHNPFAAAQNGAYRYDNALGQRRIPAVTALFEQMLIGAHDQHVAMWQAVHAAEREGRDVHAVRELLSAPLVAEQALLDPALLAHFAARDSAMDNPQGTDLSPWERQWQEAMAERHRQAASLLEQAR